MSCVINIETDTYKFELSTKKWMFIKTYYCIDMTDKKTKEKFHDEIHNSEEIGDFPSFVNFLQKMKMENKIPLVFDRYISHLLMMNGNTSRRATQISENMRGNITSEMATLTSKNKKNSEQVKDLTKKNKDLHRDYAKLKINNKMIQNKNDELASDNIYLHKQLQKLNEQLQDLNNTKLSSSSNSSHNKKRRPEWS